MGYNVPIKHQVNEYFKTKPITMNKIIRFISAFSFLLLSAGCNNFKNEPEFQQALHNGQLANEGYIRCNRFVEDWLKHADPETGLIPRNLNESKDFWNAKDAAADNYPFMALTAAITNRELFNRTIHDMLLTETKLTSRLGNLPDTYSFSKNGFVNEQVDTAAILFGASEYVKDGLLPLTEWLGESPWSERMIAVLDDIWLYAQVSTPFGKIPSENVELNGEMMQVLSRIYWMTGDEKYLEWATRLADYYLLGNHHPTRDFTSLRLRDHGCEVVSGLCEVYVTTHFAALQKKEAYEKPLKEMLDRILESGANHHGMFYNVINPQTGEATNSGIADTWGYTYNGYYSVYLLDSTNDYHNAVLTVLSNLNFYENYNWESNSADGYADAVESALNLYAREPVKQAADWIDSETQIMWHMQDSAYSGRATEWTNSGIIEGWHGDGNFARTTVMYNLWKTQGITIEPWREDVIYGAVQANGKLYVALKTKDAWEGVLKFDVPRHRVNMNLPVDYPRINQFPEWFVAEAGKRYKIKDIKNNTANIFTGTQLAKGIKIQLIKEGISYLTVQLQD